MKLPEMYDAICASGRVFCVYACMIACICMFILAQEHCVSGLWAACKSQRLGGRKNHRLTPQLFSQPFVCLHSLTTHKEMFAVQTQTHTHTRRLSGMQTNAHGELTDNEFFFADKCPSEWSARPQMQPLITERTSVGDGEKLHTSSWKLDDCSMCSCLTGDP